MADTLYTAVNFKINDEYVAAGEEVKPSDFSDAELEQFTNQGLLVTEKPDTAGVLDNNRLAAGLSTSLTHQVPLEKDKDLFIEQDKVKTLEGKVKELAARSDGAVTKNMQLQRDLDAANQHIGELEAELAAVKDQGRVADVSEESASAKPAAKPGK